MQQRRSREMELADFHKNLPIRQKIRKISPRKTRSSFFDVESRISLRKAEVFRRHHVANDPVNWVDPTGLARGDWWDPRTYVLPIVEGGQGATDFARNYSNMRQANTIGADKYFHCMANCQASQRGPGGQSAAVGISEGRELFDQYIKGDSENACNADRAANAQGRSGAGGGACSQVCGSLRPGGLGPQW